MYGVLQGIARRKESEMLAVQPSQEIAFHGGTTILQLGAPHFTTPFRLQAHVLQSATKVEPLQPI